VSPDDPQTDSRFRRRSVPAVVFVVASLVILAVAFWLALRGSGNDTVVSGDGTGGPGALVTTSPADTRSVTSTSSTEVTTSSSSTSTSSTEPVRQGLFTGRLATPVRLLDEPGGRPSGLRLDRGSILGLTGEVSETGGTVFWEAVSDGVNRWVPADVLRTRTTPFEGRPCRRADSIVESPVGYSPATSAEGADGVLAVETYRQGGCVRLVVLFGTGTGAALSPAAGLPDGLEVVDHGGPVSIRLPDGIANYWPTQAMLAAGPAYVVAARDEGGSALGIEVDPGRAAVSVSFLANPARVVVDLVPEAGADPPVVGDGVVIDSATVARVHEGGGGPLLIEGYSRPTAGIGLAVMRSAPAADAATGSGEPATVVWGDGNSGRNARRPWFSYTTLVPGPDWSRFSITVDGLAPGRYEAYVGLADDEPEETGVGAYLPFEVSGG